MVCKVQPSRHGHPHRGSTINAIPSHCAAPDTQAVGGPADNQPLQKQMLWDCSFVTQDSLSSVPMPGEPAGTGRGISNHISSLSLPAKLLSPNDNIPETFNNILSLQPFSTIRMGPQEPRWDAGMNLPRPQRGMLEKPGRGGGRDGKAPWKHTQQAQGTTKWEGGIKPTDGINGHRGHGVA